MKKQAVLALLLLGVDNSFAGEPVKEQTMPPNAEHHQGMASDGAFHHRFQNAEQWAKKFDEPQRDEWQKPDQVIAAMKLTEAMRVADIGAGTGYFSTRLAKQLPKGKVYAGDIELNMVRYLAERAKKENLPNITPIQTTAENANLPEAVDRILLVDVYHHIGHRKTYFTQLAKSLKKDGLLVIVDFKMDSPDGPPKMHRISLEKLTEELTAAGYQFIETHDFLPRQYLAIYQKVAR